MSSSQTSKENPAARAGYSAPRQRHSEVLIVIPAYNESASLPKLIEDIREACPDYDYVIVNDGSRDATRKICAQYGFNLLDLPVNLGLSGAVRAGIRYANYCGYDYAIQIDGDGQHRPEYIPSLLKCMEETNADIVIGSRFKTEKKPFTLRMIGSRLISGAIRLTTHGHTIGDVTSGMRLYNKRMIKKFGYGLNYRPEPDTIAYLINHGARVEEVQVCMRERESGTSYLNLGMSTQYMLHVLFNILFFQWVRKE